MSDFARWIFARDGNAVASVLFAVAGLIGFGIILGPIAIGLGLLARHRIERGGSPGINMAWAGILIGAVATIYPIVLIAR